MHTADGRNLAPPQKPWSDEFRLNASTQLWSQWFQPWFQSGARISQPSTAHPLRPSLQMPSRTRSLGRLHPLHPLDPASGPRASRSRAPTPRCRASRGRVWEIAQAKDPQPELAVPDKCVAKEDPRKFAKTTCDREPPS